MSILVGYVPSPEGEAAAAAGIAEAKLRGEDLLIVNSVREGGAWVDKAVASDADLLRLQQLAEKDGVQMEILRPDHRDDVATEILDLASARQVSLIVIGLRQRSQVGKLLMGSHAQRILLQADRPVLAVKAPEHMH
jgi:nucleotide-binding universal stress UspA family protein